MLHFPKMHFLIFLIGKSKCKISSIFAGKTQSLHYLLQKTILICIATLCKISTEPILKKINGKNIISILITDDLAYQLQNTPICRKIVNNFAQYIHASGLNVLRTSQGIYLNHPIHENNNTSNIFKNIYFLTFFIGKS